MPSSSAPWYITLAAIELPERAGARLDGLLSHPDLERARFVIDMLSHRKTPESAAQLVGVLRSGEMRRAKLVAQALRERSDAAPALASALAKCEDEDRARLIASVLRPFANTLTNAQRKKLLDAALARLAAGGSCWQSALSVARDANPKLANKGLRGLYAKLVKRRKHAPAVLVLRQLCRSDDANDADRYQLAARMLSSSAMDTSASARRGDEALRLIERLLRNGYDVASALRRDRSVALDALYYVGFHFAEQQHPAGEELLLQVAAKGGRKKIARMAKNKLSLG